ncbi:MAG: hypothetical protein LBR59_01865 [Endomicrobium sp.]|jgi:hypothetical protein|nr:hypothetical protein [Endomicrobium sp.]
MFVISKNKKSNAWRKNPSLEKVLIEIDETCIGEKSRHRSGGKTIKEMGDTQKQSCGG